jgi:hypothetical protein
VNARDKVLVAMQRAFLVLRGRHVNNKETEALLAVAEAVAEQPCREKERDHTEAIALCEAARKQVIYADWHSAAQGDRAFAAAISALRGQ